jgi:hypothetical protein
MRPRLSQVLPGFCTLLALLAWHPAPVQAAPDQIVSKRMRILSAERYQALRDEWKAYTKAHPGDPHGWTQLALASRYSDAPCPEYVGYAETALRLDPNDAGACAALGSFRAFTECGANPDDPSGAIRLLERALELDPSLEVPRLTLWVLHITQGRSAEAEADLRGQLEHGLMPEPLVDFGYNLLVGVEPNAIILTNGDSDTYPPLAVQAARGFRTDVAIVNVPLLNTQQYRRELRNGRLAVPVPLLDAEIRSGQAKRAVAGLVENLKKEGWRRPLYLAVTVDQTQTPIMNELSLEGLVYRVLPGDRKGAEVRIDRERLTRNLDQLYRLESTTSLGVNWEAWSAVRQIVKNYAGARVQLATALAAAHDLAGARGQMVRALELCEFHTDRDGGRQMVALWARWDPRSPQLERWKEKFDR